MKNKKGVNFSIYKLNTIKTSLETAEKVDFFLVGAVRCGTTSLYNYLNNYEEVYLPNVKEPNFFSDVESPKPEDYDIPKPDIKYHTKIITSNKVYNSLYVKATKNQVKGDISPSYLWDKNSAKKIFDYNPKAKIIISLRHPVDRAYSHYIMNYFTGVDKYKSFKEALNAPDNLIWGSCNQYLEMSSYYEQVKVFFDIFPKEQIKIIVYEDWTKDINNCLEELFGFLDLRLDYMSTVNTFKHNKTKSIRNIYFLNLLRKNGIKRLIKKLLNQELVDKLKSFFFENNNEIEKLDIETRNFLSLQFKRDIEKLSQLTNIDFINKWNN